MISNAQSNLEWNIKTHNKLAREYESMHGEIYNNYEQSRLSSELRFAIGAIKTSSKNKVAVDFGCGAGNLTEHLSKHGCNVIATDVSQGFLDLVGSKNYPTKVTTVLLNGIDLSNIPDKSVDMVVTYSVLHHIPDYLGILREFMRILKFGGVLYIDHENSDDYWLRNHLYQEFNLEMRKFTPLNYSKYFILNNYYDWLIRQFVNPRYHREGDIHVFDDDHIEWNKIEKTLYDLGAEVILSKSYLLFRRNYNLRIYQKYENHINDMHMLLIRKK